MKILLCGGGNAIHVLSSYISAQDDTNVTVLSLFPGEADKLRDAIPAEGIRCINDLGDDVYGKPDAVIDKVENLPKDLDIVIFALPSFTHEMYLKALKPYLMAGVTIGAMPAEGAFDLCAIHELGGDFVKHSNLFALETLPWACRIVEYGKSVEVLGTTIVYRYFGRHQINNSMKREYIPFIILGPSIGHWHAIGELLSSKGYSVMACEVQPPAADGTFSAEGTEAVVTAVLKAMRWRQAVVVGCDFGNVVALKAALRLSSHSSSAISSSSQVAGSLFGMETCTLGSARNSCGACLLKLQVLVVSDGGKARQMFMIEHPQTKKKYLTK